MEDALGGGVESRVFSDEVSGEGVDAGGKELLRDEEGSIIQI